jgi:uncharacterized protein (TIGR02284 family)
MTSKECDVGKHGSEDQPGFRQEKRMTTRTGDIRVLERLAVATHDSMEGYRAAAGKVGTPGLRELFRYRALERQAVSELLRQQVRALGGEAREGGSVLGWVHRAFMNLRHLMQADDEAVIVEIDRGESHARARYEEALLAGRLTPMARSTVLRAYQSVLTGLDDARHMERVLHPRRG